MTEASDMEAAKTYHQPNSRANSSTKASLQHLDELLDEALAETFPASDPVSIDIDAEPNAGDRDLLRVVRADRKSWAHN